MPTRDSTRPSGIRSALERLEEREVPAVAIVVDYSLDLRANGGAGFFETNPEAKATMNRVAWEMGQRVTANFAALAPAGGNTWRGLFYDPRNGGQYAAANLNVPANTIVIYAGARAMPGAEAAVGGSGGYSWSGSAAWGNTIARRGWSGFSLWGGSISFDTTVRWHTGLTTAGLDANELDLYSVATHELGHVLGIGTAPQWFSRVQGSSFVGSVAQSLHGGPVPLSADRAHWADGVTYNGRPVSLDPSIGYGSRVTWTSLDQAGLRDIGWAGGTQVSPPTTPPPPQPPPPPPVPSPPTVPLPPVGNAGRPPVLVSGAGGAVYFYARGADGNLADTGRSFTPFAGFAGPVRTAVADFTGDRVADYAFATGRGTAARVRVIDGATGTDIVAPTTVLGGFGGGVFVAAGDLDDDGRAELAVSADAGGLPVVRIFSVDGGQLVSVARVVTLNPRARCGVRVAMGDVDGDGAAELVTAAGPGGPPVVRIYDGAALAGGRAVLDRPAFLAFAPALRAGVNVAIGDVDGDGHGDLVVSQGAGGSTLVRVWSGAAITDNPGVRVSGLAPYQQFFANGTGSRDGIRVAARDIDGDGDAEVVTAPAGGSLDWLRVLSVTDADVEALAALFPADAGGAPRGVYVG